MYGLKLPLYSSAHWHTSYDNLTSQNAPKPGPNLIKRARLDFADRGFVVKLVLNKQFTNKQVVHFAPWLAEDFIKC